MMLGASGRVHVWANSCRHASTQLPAAPPLLRSARTALALCHFRESPFVVDLPPVK